MKKYKWLLKFGILFLISLLNVIDVSPITQEWDNPANKGVFFFVKEENASLLLNNEPLFPNFNPKTNMYEPISVSALQPNQLSYGNKKRSFKLKKISPGDFISVFINKSLYRISLYNPHSLPTYKTHFTKAPKGYYFITPSHSSKCKKSAAFILNEKGDLLYYRRNPTLNRCVSDFKKVVLPNKKVRFTLMEQEKQMPPHAYWSGSLLVMDENFQPMKRLKLLPYKGHKALPVENHHSVYLDDNHYILSSYYQTETLDENEYPIKIAAAIVQEIKDDKVVFEFNSANYPLFLKNTFLEKYSNSDYNDYMHFNSCIIDPKDGNWILSFANQFTLVKIVPKGKGHIQWILGGEASSFPLDINQYFLYQHAPVFAKDGSLMLYDNGVYRSYHFKPTKRINYSRVLKFKLDEKNKKIINFKEIPLPYTAISMGSAFETEDNTLLVAGGAKREFAILELDQKNKRIFRVETLDTETYRAYKYKTLD